MEFTIGHILFGMIGFWLGLITAGGLAATKNANFGVVVILFLLMLTEAIFVMISGDIWIGIACGVFAVFSLWLLLVGREPKSALLATVLGLVPISLLTFSRLVG